MSNILVVGANRGIGLQLVREYASRGANVFATYRKENAELKKVQSQYSDRINLLPVEITDQAAVQAAAAELKKSTDSLDTVLLVAGVLLDKQQQADQLDSQLFLDTLNANVIGAHNAARAFSPFLENSAKANHGSVRKPQLVFFGTAVGSLAAVEQINQFMATTLSVDKPGITPAYAVSKTAISMLSRQWNQVLAPRGVRAIVIHPGAVKTDMFARAKNDSMLITVEASAGGLVTTLAAVEEDKAGSGILTYDNNVLPW